MQTSSFERQHTELVELATDLMQKAKAAQHDGGAPARQTLLQLAGKLKVHLAMEDKSLYPAMLGSSSAKTVATTQRFMDEMGGLAEAFGTYCARWGRLSDIDGDPATFAAETRSIVDALGQRIAREDTQLYPLAAQC